MGRPQKFTVKPDPTKTVLRGKVSVFRSVFLEITRDLTDSTFLRPLQQPLEQGRSVPFAAVLGVNAEPQVGALEPEST